MIDGGHELLKTVAATKQTNSDIWMAWHSVLETNVHKDGFIYY